MYYECTVKVSDEAVKEYLQEYGGYSEEEVESMSSHTLQNEAREAVDTSLSNFMSDYYVTDENTIFVG